MQVKDIAKSTGLESKKVAEDFGLEMGQGVAMRQVDDEKALEYIAQHGGEVPDPSKPDEQRDEHKVVRFWSVSKNYTIPAHGDVGDITFRKWVFQAEAGSPEVREMRRLRDYFIVQHTYEEIETPHRDPMMIAQFMSALNGTIHTGPQGDLTPSVEMRNAVKAMLPPAIAAKLTTVQKNNPRQLVRSVAENMSLAVSDYQEKL